MIVLIPEFLVTDYDINTGFCLEMYRKLWMGKGLCCGLASTFDSTSFISDDCIIF